MGVLQFKVGRQVGRCTATLVGKNLVLTNAHCVYNKRSRSLYSGFTFYPGLKYSPSASSKSANGTSVYVSTKYKQGNRSSDWALVKLDKNFGSELGYLEVKSLNLLQVIKDNNFYVPGYGSNFQGNPLSKFFPIPSVNPSACRITGQTSTYYNHNCDTGPGNSGSPVLKYEGKQAYVVGVHFGGNGTFDRVNYACKVSEGCTNNATRASEFLGILKDLTK
jgi:V8-like Glu-specific endopeptidase